MPIKGKHGLEAFSKFAETSRRGTGAVIGDPEQTSPPDHPFRPAGTPELSYGRHGGSNGANKAAEHSRSKTRNQRRIDFLRSTPAGDGRTLLQAVQRQRVVPAVADRHDLLDHLRGRLGGAGAWAPELADEGGREYPLKHCRTLIEAESGVSKDTRGPGPTWTRTC